MCATARSPDDNTGNTNDPVHFQPPTPKHFKFAPWKSVSAAPKAALSPVSTAVPVTSVSTPPMAACNITEFCVAASKMPMVAVGLTSCEIDEGGTVTMWSSFHNELISSVPVIVENYGSEIAESTAPLAACAITEFSASEDDDDDNDSDYVPNSDDSDDSDAASFSTLLDWTTTITSLAVHRPEIADNQSADISATITLIDSSSYSRLVCTE